MLFKTNHQFDQGRTNKIPGEKKREKKWRRKRFPCLHPSTWASSSSPTGEYGLALQTHLLLGLSFQKFLWFLWVPMSNLVAPIIILLILLQSGFSSVDEAEIIRQRAPAACCSVLLSESIERRIAHRRSYRSFRHCTGVS